MTETTVNLNVHEVGVILSALQLLENVDENRIAREYGSTQALYDKMYQVWQGMDTSQTGLRNDVVPSFWPIIRASRQGDNPMQNYRVSVETNDGCVTIWYEKSKAKTADKLILNRVYNQLCGLNIKEINVVPSV